VRDSAFDSVTVITNAPGLASATDYDYNAYLTNWGETLPPGPHDLVVTNFNWCAGPLGGWYLNATSPLINSGSLTNAGLAGLFHFTTITNMLNGWEIKETNSVLDIGYHYVAFSTNGLPISTSGDGLGDYFKDSNGDGIYNVGDLGNWRTNDTCGDGISDYIKYIEGRNLNVKAVLDTNGVIGLQVYTPLK
jgi:hypothetical protein